MPRDIPIIFSKAMVLALLDGRKTMTRRLAISSVKPSKKDMQIAADAGLKGVIHKYRPSPWQSVKPGDRLWARESAWFDRDILPAVGAMRCFFEGGLVRFSDGRSGSAPGAAVSTAEMFRLNKTLKMKPSIHMPRWASRLTLIVTAVKVEPLQDISEADAEAEGISRKKICGLGESWTHYGNPHGPVGWLHAVQSFQSLWESLHGTDNWNANPEVVALSFRVIAANIDSEEVKNHG